MFRGGGLRDPNRQINVGPEPNKCVPWDKKTWSLAGSKLLQHDAYVTFSNSGRTYMPEAAALFLLPSQVRVALVGSGARDPRTTINLKNELPFRPDFKRGRRAEERKGEDPAAARRPKTNQSANAAVKAAAAAKAEAVAKAKAAVAAAAARASKAAARKEPASNFGPDPKRTCFQSTAGSQDMLVLQERLAAERRVNEEKLASERRASELAEKAHRSEVGRLEEGRAREDAIRTESHAQQNELVRQREREQRESRDDAKESHTEALNFALALQNGSAALAAPPKSKKDLFRELLTSADCEEHFDSLWGYQGAKSAIAIGYINEGELETLGLTALQVRMLKEEAQKRK